MKLHHAIYAIVLSATIVFFSNCGSGSENKTGGDANSDSSKTEKNTVVKITKSESSGFLQSGKDSYKPENSYDGEPTTWWTPYPQRNGVGTYIKYFFEKETEIDGLQIWNGSHYPNYPKYGNIFLKNNRLKVCTIELSNGTKYCFKLADIDDFQTVSFPATKTSSVKISIDATYPGSQWNDACISEIKFLDNTENPSTIDAKPWDSMTVSDLSVEEFTGTFKNATSIGGSLVLTLLNNNKEAHFVMNPDWNKLPDFITNSPEGGFGPNPSYIGKKYKIKYTVVFGSVSEDITPGLNNIIKTIEPI